MTSWDPQLMRGEPTGSPDRLRHFIDGRFVDSPAGFVKHSPVTGKPLYEVAEADAATVDAAVAAARAALGGPWGQLSDQQRATMLRRIADELERRFDDFLAAEVADTGKPVTQARTLDVARGAANFRTSPT